MMCPVCDNELDPREPHDECDLTPGRTCDTDGCAFQWCVHAGECVV
ncbi:hypothetical protein SEA_ICEE_128 [Mycobacterium phage Icee]|nr:hypothetical protein SEA_ICEE_128 [Mycobacterium phage Icee]